MYVETFRNVPLLVLLVISYAGLRRSGVAIDTWTAGIGALGLYTAAYFAEVLRSGVFAVSSGQIEASLSLGFDLCARRCAASCCRRRSRTVISPLGSITIAMIKNSAIVGGGLALNDMLKEARLLNSRTFETEAAFFWAAVGYLLLTVAATIAIRVLEQRYAIRR